MSRVFTTNGALCLMQACFKAVVLQRCVAPGSASSLKSGMFTSSGFTSPQRHRSYLHA